MNNRLGIRISLVISLVISLMLLSGLHSSGIRAAVCVQNPVVINNADSGAGSLRQAILDACDGNTITFANTVISPITLVSELAIDKNLTIQGPGANLLFISGNNTVRVFNVGSVTPAINVTLSGLAIGNGEATDSSAGGSKGGGIFNNSTGTLSVTNSIISGNSASSGTIGEGGGILNNTTGTVNVANVLISGNSASGGIAGEGAGIFNFNGVLNVTNSRISGNTASGSNAGQGGGIENNGGAVNVTNSAISGNTATSSGGGAGGGIISVGGAVSVTNTTISGNSASGGIAGQGAGIFNANGVLNVTNSGISGNTASGSNAGQGGGIENIGGAVNVTNSTISGNTATSSGVGEGGGILSLGGAVNVTNSTISRNTAISTFGVGEGGGIFAGLPVSLTLKASIIALNSVSGPGGVVGPDVFGASASLGHNLVGKSDGSVGFANGLNNDQVGSIVSPLDPKLGPLQNNGGPTSTMALLAGSPAIDAGDDSVLGSPLFLTTDQRGAGFPRKSGSHVDIGAFELQQVVVGPSFDTCLKDNSTGNLLQWSSTTGVYTFTRCSDGFTLSGTGAAGLVNGIRTLTDFKADRRISAGFNTGQLTGSATIYLGVAPGVWQTFRIIDSNPSAVCICPG